MVPGEGNFTCDEREMVDLVAVAEGVRWFVNWSDDVDTIANIHTSEPTVPRDGDYSIITNPVCNF